MPKAEKHCKLHYFRAWQAAKKLEKIAKKVSKMDLRNASWNFSIFFPDPKWAKIIQNSISRRSQIQTSKNRPKTTKTPPVFGLGAKS